MRTTGTYTTYQGSERVIAYRDGDVARLRAVDDPDKLAERVPLAELGDIVRVVVTARWRDGQVVVNGVADAGEITFLTQDKLLAEREGLRGDRYSGWGGKARIDELHDVHEDVTRTHAGGPS